MSRKRLMLALGVVLPPLGAVLLALLHTWPLEAEASLAAAEERTLAARVSQAQDVARRFRDVDQAETPVVTQLEPLLDRLVDDVRVPPRFLPLFQRIAANCDVRIRSCRWSTARKRIERGPAAAGVAKSDTPAFKTISFFLTVRGGQEPILAFLGALESNPRPITISAVDIKRKSNPRRPLEARIRAEVVVRARG